MHLTLNLEHLLYILICVGPLYTYCLHWKNINHDVKLLLKAVPARKAVLGTMFLVIVSMSAAAGYIHLCFPDTRGIWAIWLPVAITSIITFINHFCYVDAHDYTEV